ncbi:MAG: ribosome-associated translation inhibitor RaiA [Alphaproteobacteria bacterium]|nr:ribosome-associated translation inhibitor RaiA [Alphaproteobacteria bacterium]
MKITVSGKQLTIGENLTPYVSDHLNTLVEKYFPEDTGTASVIFSKEGTQIRVDIALRPIEGGLLINATSTNANAYDGYDEAAVRIQSQLRKYKNRLKDHKSFRSEPIQVSVIEPEHEVEEFIEAEGAPVIVAEMQAELPTCTVSGAVMRMDLANVPALMFKNSAHGRLNMVYKRADGNIGWIDPKN